LRVLPRGPRMAVMVAKQTQGLVIVFHGDGKGKTTAALGMGLRAAGHKMPVAVVQFVKAWNIGEHDAALRLAPYLKVYRMGQGYVREATPEHVVAAGHALDFTRQCMINGEFRMVVADEILAAVALNLLAPGQVESLLDVRPPDVHLVLTGRVAWPSLIERADLVTEMRLVKHPYQKGFEAQPGVEY
jgi:cob(I)alamin adenosyltransferase